MSFESSLAWVLVTALVLIALICRKLGRGPSLDGMVRYLILMRVPLLALLALMGLPWVLARTRLFGNLFVLSDPFDLAVVSAVAVVATSSCVLTARLIARLARFRFHVAHAPLRQFLPVSAIAAGSPGHVLLANLAAIPLLAVLSAQADEGNTAVFACVGGMSVGTVVTLAADALLRWVFGYHWSEDAVRREQEPEKKDWLWDGYKLPDRRGLFGAHYAALSSLLILISMFVAGIAYFGPGEPLHAHVPPITYLLFLAALINTLFSGMTFFFDRFRIPLIGALVIAKMLAFPFSAESEYVFEVRPLDAPLRPATVEAIVRRITDRSAVGADGTVIVVCTAGGGIQAAAWTAHVLTTLDDAVPGFRRRVGLISGASGGSVGAMFYIEALRRAAETAEQNGLSDYRLDQHDLDDVVDASTTSSLSAIGWSLVFRDLPRLLSLTPPTFRDRGWAMEQVWMQALSRSPPLRATLGDWVAATRSGAIPPLAFNATIAASRDPDLVGRRLVFSTVDLSTNTPGLDVSPIEFHDGFPTDAAPRERAYFDIAMTTAARMSATFPYVSPIAGAATRGDDDTPVDLQMLRLADGGYFDNYGVATAVNWLREARDVRDDAGASLIKRVAIVCIEPFPEPVPDEDSDPRLPTEWHHPASAPIELLLNAWDAAQRVRGELDKDLVERWLEEAGSAGTVEVFRFRPPPTADGRPAGASTERARRRMSAAPPADDDGRPHEPPLSWHLTPADRNRVIAGWDVGNEERLQELLSWLGH